MRMFFLRTGLIERCYVGGFPLKEETKHCFLSIKVLLWCCGFIHCVVLLLFSAKFMLSVIIIDWVPNIFPHACG
jgi:hypothetical protein